jgi:predicted nuclease with TOPRIM domain
VIAKTEDLEQLKHRKEYVEKLIESELAEQKELTKTNGELESILAAKREKLMFIDKVNSEYVRMIEEEKERNEESLFLNIPVLYEKLITRV